MSRQRLTTKVAGEIAGDVYTMNNPEKEKSDPKIDEYAKGSPSEWGEDVVKDMSKLPKSDEDSRDKDIRQASEYKKAIRSASELEAKAVKCIVAAQRMLPGASGDVIEAQAADLMELPDHAVMATLARQERLAQSVLAKAEELTKEVEEDADKTAAMSAEEKKEFAEKMEKAREAGEDGKGKMKDIMFKGSSDDGDADDKDETKEAAKVEDGDETKEAAKVEDEDETKEAAKVEDEDEDEDDEMGKEASLLDQIFNSVEASDSKRGASSLSGMVKKEASNKLDDLSSLWGSVPDVNHIFG